MTLTHFPHALALVFPEGLPQGSCLHTVKLFTALLQGSTPWKKISYVISEGGECLCKGLHSNVNE